MSPKDKKSAYKYVKPIVTEYDGVTFSTIHYESESSKEAEGKIDALMGKLGLRGKKDSKWIAITSVVSDPRIPIKGPVPIAVWEKCIGDLVLKKGEITEHIAETVTLESGFHTKSADVELNPVYRDLSEDKIETFIQNSEKIFPKLKYQARLPESGLANVVDIWTSLSEDSRSMGSENCQLCWFIIETEKRELLCAKKKGPCFGKIVESLHKCKLFIARADLTSTTRVFVEETKDEKGALEHLKVLGRHVCKET